MILSSKTEYALKTLVDLAGRAEGEVATVGDIARRCRIPLPFLEQILLILKRGGLVVSRRGRKGGYQLDRPEESIRLLDVMRLTGDVLLDASGSRRSDGRDRAVAELWDRINGEFIQALERVTVRELREAVVAVEAPTYVI